MYEYATCACVHGVMMQLVEAIDGADNRIEALEIAKAKDSRLAAFIDEMLLAVGACERRPDGSVGFVMGKDSRR